MRIAVCAPQVPFVRGGAEIMADRSSPSCARATTRPSSSRSRSSGIRGRASSTRRSSGACSTSTESDGRPIDLVLATKFPSYVVRHPNKVVWVLHQFRQAYELDRTDLGQFSESPEDRASRRAVQRLDRVALGEAKRLFATSRNVADRLERSTGLAAEVLPHPPQELPYRNDGYGDFVLSVGRLDRAKRIDLLLEAAALDRPARRDRRRRPRPRAARGARRERGLNGRAEFPGRVDEAELADLYARCLAVYYAPVDEDFGMVPYEAFLAEKPVLTTTDAGGPLEVVARPAAPAS